MTDATDQPQPSEKATQALKSVIKAASECGIAIGRGKPTSASIEAVKQTGDRCHDEATALLAYIAELEGQRDRLRLVARHMKQTSIAQSVTRPSDFG